MPLVITDIKPAVHNANRVNVFVDGKYSFSFDIAQVVDYKLKIGRHLTETELSACQHASEFGKLYQRTLEWALTRPHSVKETRDYLIRRRFKLRTSDRPTFSDADITDVISRLISHGHLDDRKFATFFVENRSVKKGISHRRLEQELYKKGIDKSIISEVLSAGSRTDEQEIKKIILKKRSRYNDDQLISYLARQGFDFELARNLVRETDSRN